MANNGAPGMASWPPDKKTATSTGEKDSVSAIEELADFVKAQEGASSMSPEEVARFREGEEKRRARVAAAAVSVEANAAIEQMALEETAVSTEETPDGESSVPAAPLEPRASALRDHAEAIQAEEATLREQAKAPALPKAPDISQKEAVDRARAAMKSAPVEPSGGISIGEAQKRAYESVKAGTAGISIAEAGERVKQALDAASTPKDPNNPLSPSNEDLTHTERVTALKRSLTEALGAEAGVRTPQDLYELRVKTFAEHSGLVAEYDAVRSAQAAYKEARLKNPAAKEDPGVRAAYNQALFVWRKTLLEKAPTLEGRAGMEALVFAKRETVLGPAALDTEIRLAALNEKGKTAFGKATQWLGKTAPGIVRAINKPFELAGKGAAMVLHRDTEARAAYAARYARAARILVGAGIATGLAIGSTPVSATGALLTFMVYGARGTLGVAAGMGSAKLSGGLFDRLIGNKKQAELKEDIRSAPSTIEEYVKLQEAYRKSNATMRAKQRMGVQMLGALVGGAGTGLLSSPIAHSMLEHMGALRSVDAAAQTVAEVNGNSPEAAAQGAKVAGKLAASAGSSQETASVIHTPGSTAAEVAPTDARLAGAPVESPDRMVGGVVGRGQGFGELVMNMRENIKVNLPAGYPHSPALDHVLTANPNDIAREIAALRGGESMVMQPGDQLFADTDGNVWFQARGEDARMLFENSPKAAGGYTAHQFADATSMKASVPTERGTTQAAPAPQEDPSAALNRAQVAPRVVAPAPEPVTVERVEGVKPASGADIKPTTLPSDLDTTVRPVESAPVRPVVPPTEPTPAPRPQAPAEPYSPFKGTDAPRPISPADIPTTPFTNGNGVPVNPNTAMLYELRGGTKVLWGGSFQEQLSAARQLVGDAAKQGKSLSVIVECARLNPYTNQMETTYYEYATNAPNGAVRVYPPGSLPFKPFGPEDFIK